MLETTISAAPVPDLQVEQQDLVRIKDFSAKFGIPANPYITGLARIYFALQVTIISSLLWMPWGDLTKEIILLAFTLTLDLLRVLLWPPARILTFNPIAFLRPTKTTLESVYRRDKQILWPIFVISLFLPLAAALIPTRISYFFQNVASHLTFFSDFRNIAYYGFSSAENLKDSINFLVLLHAVSFCYLMLVSTIVLSRWDLGSVFTSKTLSKPLNDKPKNLTNSLSTAIAGLLVTLVFYNFFAPSNLQTFQTGYDWLGPMPMWLYGLSEFFVIFICHALTRGVLLSVQFYFAIARTDAVQNG
jgi:hypothetical protein